MAAAITPARSIRLQFSLRMLLLLMAGVALGLAIFRWPWSETIVEKDVARTTTYRLGWNGKPLKHGLQTVANESRQRTRDALYEDGVLRRERMFDARGQLATDIIHFPERGETVERFYVLARDPSIIASPRIWDRGARLRREWRTSAGALLESVEFDCQKNQEDLQLVRWNDRPIAEATQELLEQLPQQQQEFWTKHGWLSNQWVSADLGDSTFLAGTLLHIDSADGNPLVGIPLGSRVNYFLCPTSSTPKGPLIHELLAHAHARHQTLQCRFGILCVVPINAETIAAGDPTGALGVQFAAETTAAAAWLENVVSMDQSVESRPQRLQQFFRDTGIEIDASALTETELHLPANPSTRKLAQDSPRINYIPDTAPRRTRRDTLGVFLWHHRLRVEQRGTKLVISARKEPRTQ